MRIGIDIDGVITNFEDYWVERAAKYNYMVGRKIVHKQIYNLDVSAGFRDSVGDDWDEENELAFGLFMRTLLYDYLYNCPVRVTAPEVIKRLHELGHEIFIVTKRYNSYTWLSIDDAKKEVKNFLDINNIYYDEICYTEEHQDKKEYCEQLSLDILLDDNPYEIQALKDSSIKSICFNAGYNHNNTDGVFARVYSFYEFLELIESL